MTRDPSQQDAAGLMRADAHRNRGRIIEAATELIERDGLSVPLDEIARRAGVGPGTVHRHFASKDVLFAAIVVDRVGQVAAEARALATAGDPGDALVRALAAMLAEGERSLALKAALAGTGFDLRTAAPQASADLRDAVTVLLSRGQRAGAIRGDVDTGDVMALLAGAFAAIQHSGGDPARAATLASVLFDGLRGTAGPGTQRRPAPARGSLGVARGRRPARRPPDE